MIILQIVLSVIAGIIVLFFLAALLIKKEFTLAKEVTIGRPKQEVFDYIKLIRNQEQYSVWVTRDPHIKLVYTGTDGMPGFTSAWESKDRNVGIGEQEIKHIKEGESIEMEIRFKKPFEGTNRALTTVTTVGNGQTKVLNVFSGKSKFPMNVMNLFMDKLVGKDMQKNLENMKARLEK